MRNIFTDASITVDREGNGLFSTHGVVVLDSEFKLVTSVSYNLNITNNIVKAEEMSLMLAMDFMTEGSKIYTDCLTNATNNVKLHKLIKCLGCTIQWIPREQNSFADMLCSKKRNERLALLKKAEDSENLPKLRKVEQVTVEYVENFAKSFNPNAKKPVKQTKAGIVSINNFNILVQETLTNKGINLNKSTVEHNKELKSCNITKQLSELEINNLLQTYQTLVKKEYRMPLTKVKKYIKTLNIYIPNTKVNRRLLSKFVVVSLHTKNQIVLDNNNGLTLVK